MFCTEPLTNTYYFCPQYVLSTYIVSQLAKLVGSFGKMSTQIFRKLLATKFSFAGSVRAFLSEFTKSLQESQMLNLVLSSNINDFTGLVETVGALQSPMISQTWWAQKERIEHCNSYQIHRNAYLFEGPIFHLSKALWYRLCTHQSKPEIGSL